MRRLTSRAIALVLAGGILGASDQVVERTIPYDHRVPVSDRLTTADTTVMVVKPFPHSLVSPFVDKDSLEEEILLLSQHETIVVVGIVESASQLVDGGTWLRTRSRARAKRLVKAGPLVSALGSVEFWDDGGTTTIGKVTVIAGVYPRFIEQQDYLVFLRTDRARGTTYAALAFHVNTQGIVESMQLTNGVKIAADSNLIGRSISEVASAFAKVK